MAVESPNGLKGATVGPLVRLVLGLLVFLVPPTRAGANPFATPLPQRSRFGINLSGVNDQGSNHLWADAIKSARPWRDARAQGKHGDQEFPLAKDAHGYPLLEEGQQAVTRLLNRFCPAGIYVMTWQGTAEFAWETPGLTIRARGPQRLEFEGRPTDSAVITLLRSDQLRDLHFWMPGMEHHPSVFHPDFIATLYCFGTLRYMDLMRTNRSPITRWEERPQVADFTYAEKGVPLEHLIALANQLDAHPWFCMPERADDDYVIRSARMVSAQLKPTLNPIVEYSNEVGNGSFAVFRYATEMGTSLRLASPEDVDPWNAANAAWLAQHGLDFTHPTRPMSVGGLNRHRFQGQQTARISRLWKAEFMDPTRVKVVVTGSADQVQVALSHADTSQHVDWIAACSYWGHGITKHLQSPLTNLTAEDIFALLEADLETALRHRARQMGLLSRMYRKPLVLYEGGQHLSRYGGGYDRFAEADQAILRRVFLQCQRHPRMGELMQKDFDLWFGEGASLYAVFAHLYPASGDFAWGLLEYLGQPLDEAPKARALLEYMRRPEVGIGARPESAAAPR